ncbi:MAG: phage tail protein [bacterium]|nr:phage tail protein [bacterium]
MKKITFLLIFISAACHLQAKIPGLITYQGRLQQGMVPANGNKNILFSIWDSESGGTEIWRSDLQTVHVTNGLFNTYIGLTTSGGFSSISNINWDNYDTAWLQIRVETEILSPRVQFVSAPYALISKTVVSNSLTPGKIRKGWGLVPAGTIMIWPCSTPPEGWLECNGTLVNKSAYPELYTALKNSGASCIYGENITQFYLPDLRGYFIRGWDHGAARDPDRASRTDRGDGTTGDNVGTRQDEQFKSHYHTDEGCYNTGLYDTSGSGHAVYIARSTTTGWEGGSETRPENIYMMFIIKY